MPYHATGGKMHMSSYGAKAAPTGKMQIGATSTTQGKGHGSDKGGLQKGAPGQPKMKGVIGGESFAGSKQMSKTSPPGGGGHGAVRGGGSGPSGNSRNISTKTSSGGWHGPISTLKAGMKSAITERQRR